jgi:hypothetical protein
LKLSLVLAQCVMCYRTAAQQGARSQVLNKGIVILSKHAMNPSGVYPLAAGYWDGWELDYRET